MHVRRRAAAVAAVTGLTAALLPLTAGAVQADPTGPSFGYVTATGGYPAHDASSDRLRATTPGDFGTTTLLTPDSYVYRYDVSDDGNTLVTTGQSRKLGLPSLNVTYGLLVTVRDPVTSAVYTRSLATYFDTNPDVTPDGTLVFWMEDGVIYRYEVASQFTTAMSSRFAPHDGEYVARMAISPDGTKAAVLYRTDKNGEPVATRLKVATFASGPAPFEDQGTFSGLSGLPWSNVLEWTADSSEVVFSRLNESGPAPYDRAYRVAPGGTPSELPELAGSYDLSRHDGSWYRFRDGGSGTDVGSSVDLDVAPADWTPFPYGALSVRYRASSVVPPVVTRPVNRAASTAALYLGQSDVSTGASVVYATLATYLTDSTGKRAYNSDAAQVRYGTLLASRDGKTFTKYVSTSAGDTLLKWPNGQLFGNGRISKPDTQQNLWLRWCFGGDLFVSGDCSSTKKITVHPTMYVSGSRDAAGRVRVTGSVARKGGTVVLWKWNGTSWRALATASVNTYKRFTFAYRPMPAGVYRVTTKADLAWGQGEYRFRV
jgi:hypothetical protein